jgi:hypothetical protein
MAWTPEQKRKRRAEHAAARAADDAVRGIKRQPPGGVPSGKRWDEHAHAFVDALPVRPAPSMSTPKDMDAWGIAHHPPRRADFESQEHFDGAREQWFATFMGTLLPPSNDAVNHLDGARSAAWSAAKERHRDLLWRQGRNQREQERQEQHDIERRERVRNPLASRSQPTTTRVHVCGPHDNARGFERGRRLFIFLPRFGTTERAIEAIKKLVHCDEDVSFDKEASGFVVTVHSANQAENMHDALREIDSALPSLLDFKDPWWVIGKKWNMSEREAKMLRTSARFASQEGWPRDERQVQPAEGVSCPCPVPCV